jgi:hypothetical protein
VAAVLATLACSVLQAQTSTVPSQQGGEPTATDAEEPTTKNKEAPPPSPWAAKKYGVAVGYSGSTVDVDVPRDGNDRLGFSGWGVTAFYPKTQPTGVSSRRVTLKSIYAAARW